ncbi:hypothetical protein [Thiothrix eikelboomii]|uniref:hypothetical protein n=1 Tax=Thiothrix eikelboomii TaxID=92487 RepID=UPI003BB1CE0E
MRQWMLLSLLSGLIACQSQSIIPPQTLLKSVGYIVYVNGSPPEQLPWAFRSQAELEAYYAKAANQLKQRSGLLDAELSIRQGDYYFLELSSEWNDGSNKPLPTMEKVYIDPENFSTDDLVSVPKKCPVVKRLEGLYSRNSYPQASYPLKDNATNWLVYYNIAMNYSRAWNKVMNRACIKKPQ